MSSKISKQRNLQTPKSVTLTIHKHDGLYFHIQTGNYSTINGWNKAEILAAEEKYKGSLKIVFANKQIENFFENYKNDLGIDE